MTITEHPDFKDESNGRKHGVGQYVMRRSLINVMSGRSVRIVIIVRSVRSMKSVRNLRSIKSVKSEDFESRDE